MKPTSDDLSAAATETATILADLGGRATVFHLQQAQHICLVGTLELICLELAERGLLQIDLGPSGNFDTHTVVALPGSSSREGPRGRLRVVKS